MKAAIHKIIDETGFKSVDKFKHAVRKKFPNITDKELREI